MLVVGLLGANLWMTALVVPTLGAQAWPLVPLLLPAPALLIFGIASGSPPSLLLGVPLAILVPLGLPELATSRASPGPFIVAALGLAGYLAAVLSALARRDAPVVVGERRALDPVARPERWQRRRRVHAAAVALALIVPAALLYAVNLDPTNVQAIASANPRPESARALLTAAAALVAMVVFAHALVRPLVGHLDGDRAVRAEVDRRRQRSWLLWLVIAFGLGLAGAAIARGALS